jgi:hypothetical protein
MLQQVLMFQEVLPIRFMEELVAALEDFRKVGLLYPIQSQWELVELAQAQIA